MVQYPRLQSYAGGNSQRLPSQLPGPQQAFQAQYASERESTLRNEYLARQAGEVYRQGAQTLTAYRPGGAAALTSGLFGGQAQAILAGRSESPDLMGLYNKYRDEMREEEARKKEVGSGIGSFLGGIGGAIFGGTAGAGVGSGLGSALGGIVGGLFAEGGIIMPTPGGTQMKSPQGNPMTVAEAGQPEVVVPLEKMGEVAAAYEGAQGKQAPAAPQRLDPQQQQVSGPSEASPPPLGRESEDQQRAGQPADELAAQQAGVPQMGANAGFVGEAFPRDPDNPGVDGLGLVGGAHWATKRLGVPSDIIHAMFVAADMDEGKPSVGAQVNAQLDFLLAEDEMMSMGVL